MSATPAPYTPPDPNSGGHPDEPPLSPLALDALRTDLRELRNKYDWTAMARALNAFAVYIDHGRFDDAVNATPFYALQELHSAMEKLPREPHQLLDVERYYLADQVNRKVEAARIERPYWRGRGRTVHRLPCPDLDREFDPSQAMRHEARLPEWVGQNLTEEEARDFVESRVLAEVCPACLPGGVPEAEDSPAGE